MTSWPPLIVAADMGYGHLRAADSLAAIFQAPVMQVDKEPLADSAECALWKRVRLTYEGISRLSQVPILGAPLREVLESSTNIPHLHPYRDLSKPTASVIAMDHWLRNGVLGRGMIEHLRKTGAPLLTTFFVPALIANSAGYDPVYCLVTDSDINRMWVPRNPERSRVHYFAPSLRALHRLRAYGVRKDQVTFTGFPLPDELLGGPELPTLRKNLAARLVRLDPAGAFREEHREELKLFSPELPTDSESKPPTLTFAVGGAGAQISLVRQFLPKLSNTIRAGKLRLALVAGIRVEIANQFREWIVEAGLVDEIDRGVLVLHEETHANYFRSFNRLLAETDILWTKPSEMTFYAALGIPLIFSWPVGVHERYNRRWAIENGAGFKQRDPRFAAEWIHEWLADGTLAGAAWCGFMRLPKFGLYRILDVLAKHRP